jgi:hypothetical protein
VHEQGGRRQAREQSESESHRSSTFVPHGLLLEVLQGLLRLTLGIGALLRLIDGAARATGIGARERRRRAR